MDTLVDAMEGWRELLDPSWRTKKNRHHYLWRRVIGSPLMLTLCGIMGSLFLGAAWHADTVDEMTRSIRMEFAFLVIFPSIAFFMLRRKPVDKELGDLQAVALQLAHLSRGNEESLKKASSLVLYLIRCSKLYALLDTLTLIVPLVLSQERMEVPMWPWPSGKMWVVLGSLSQVCLGTPFAVQGFLALSLYACEIRIIIALYEVLASAAQVADSPAKWREIALLDSKMTEVGLTVRNSISILSTFSLTLMLTPLGSSLLALKGQYDLFTIISIPYTMMYVAQCTVGHNMKDASEKVAVSAYNGHWVDLRDKEPQLHVLAILRRRMRPQAVFARFGLGVLDLVTCLEVLRSWYSFLQLMAKVF